MQLSISRRGRHHRRLRYGLATVGTLLAGLTVAWLAGLPQAAYRSLYVALAWPVQVLGESAAALHGHPHWTSWAIWTRDVDARYRWLHGPASTGTGGPIELEAGLLALIVALVIWRVCWFALTCVGRLTALPWCGT